MGLGTPIITEVRAYADFASFPVRGNRTTLYIDEDDSKLYRWDEDLENYESLTTEPGSFVYKGTWDALTNTPTLASGVGTLGDLYICSVGNATISPAIDGITSINVGDQMAFNGTIWERIPVGVATAPPVEIENADATLITNELGSYGDFAIDTNFDGLADGWTGTDANTYLLSSKVQTFTPTAQYGDISASCETTLTHEYYARAYVTTTDASAVLRHGDNNSATHSGGGGRELLSMISIPSSDTGTAEIRTELAGSFVTISVEEYMVVDLTDAYGAGNEPILSWCDENIPFLNNSEYIKSVTQLDITYLVKTTSSLNIIVPTSDSGNQGRFMRFLKSTTADIEVRVYTTYPQLFGGIDERYVIFNHNEGVTLNSSGSNIDSWIKIQDSRTGKPVPQAEFLGENNTESNIDGNWTIKPTSNDLVVYRLENGSLVQKASIGDSMDTDIVYLNAEYSALELQGIEAGLDYNAIGTTSGTKNITVGDPRARNIYIDNLGGGVYDSIAIVADVENPEPSLITQTIEGTQLDTATLEEIEFEWTAISGSNDGLYLDRIEFNNVEAFKTNVVIIDVASGVELYRGFSDFTIENGGGYDISSTGQQTFQLPKFSFLFYDTDYRITMKFDLQTDIKGRQDGGTFYPYFKMHYYDALDQKVGHEIDVVQNATDITTTQALLEEHGYPKIATWTDVTQGLIGDPIVIKAESAGDPTAELWHKTDINLYKCPVGILIADTGASSTYLERGYLNITVAVGETTTNTGIDVYLHDTGTGYEWVFDAKDENDYLVGYVTVITDEPTRQYEIYFDCRGTTIAKDRGYTTSGSFYISGTHTTTCTLANTDYKFDPTFLDGTSKNISWNDTSKRFIYTGYGDVVHVGISWNSTVDTNNVILLYVVYVNGVMIPTPVKTVLFKLSTDLEQLAIFGKLELQQNDYVELFLQSDTAVVDVDVNEINVSFWV